MVTDCAAPIVGANFIRRARVLAFLWDLDFLLFTAGKTLGGGIDWEPTKDVMMRNSKINNTIQQRSNSILLTFDTYR